MYISNSLCFTCFSIWLSHKNFLLGGGLVSDHLFKKFKNHRTRWSQRVFPVLTIYKSEFELPAHFWYLVHKRNRSLRNETAKFAWAVGHLRLQILLGCLARSPKQWPMEGAYAWKGEVLGFPLVHLEELIGLETPTCLPKGQPGLGSSVFSKLEAFSSSASMISMYQHLYYYLGKIFKFYWGIICISKNPLTLSIQTGSIVFSKSTELCNHHRSPVLGHWHCPQEILHAHLQLVPLQLWQHSSTFCFYRFAFYGQFI